MLELNEHMLEAFRDELRKEALAPGSYARLLARAKPALQAGGALGGVGTAVGAAAGGGIGAVRKYREAKEQGQSTGGAALSGLMGGLGGASTGAMVGGAAGFGAGALSRSPGVANLVNARGPIGSTARFGQRQVHGMTGMLNPNELKAIRGGSHAAEAAHAAAPTAQNKKILDITHAATGQTDGMDLTNLPGVLHAATSKEHGVGKVLSTGIREQWANNKVLTGIGIGLPAAAAGHALIAKETPDGPGRGERFGGEVAGTLGGMATTVMPLGAGMAVGNAASSVGRAVGRGVDRLRGRRPMPVPPPTSMPSPNYQPGALSNAGQHVPTERQMSPAAAGQLPGGM